MNIFLYLDFKDGEIIAQVMKKEGCVVLFERSFNGDEDVDAVIELKEAWDEESVITTDTYEEWSAS